MKQLHQDIKQSFESIESLIKRQGELELFVRERLNDIDAKLDELLFLAPVSQTLPGGDRWSYQDEARPQMPAEPGEHIPMRPLTPGEQNNASMRPLTPGEQSNTSMSTPDQNESLHVSELKVAAIGQKVALEKTTQRTWLGSFSPWRNVALAMCLENVENSSSILARYSSLKNLVLSISHSQTQKSATRHGKTVSRL